VIDGLVRRNFVVCSRDIARLEQCPATRVYRLDKKLEEKPHAGLFWGIILHRFLQYATERGPEAARAYIATKKWKELIKLCLAIDLDAIPPGQCEIGYAHNPFDGTARPIFGAFGVNQLNPVNEQWGQADLLADPRPGKPRYLLADYKTGVADEEPIENTQLLGLGTSAIRALGLDAIDVALVRVFASGQLEWRTQTLTREGAGIWENRARRVHVLVLQERRKADKGQRSEFVRGSKCEYCDLRKVCPAWR